MNHLREHLPGTRAPSDRAEALQQPISTFLLRCRRRQKSLRPDRIPPALSEGAARDRRGQSGGRTRRAMCRGSTGVADLRRRYPKRCGAGRDAARCPHIDHKVAIPAAFSRGRRGAEGQKQGGYRHATRNVALGSAQAADRQGLTSNCHIMLTSVEPTDLGRTADPVRRFSISLHLAQ